MSVIDEPGVVTEDDRRRYLDGLQELVDFLKAHPAVDFNPEYSVITILWHRSGVDELAKAARLLGRVEKRSDDSFLNLERHFGPHRIQAYSSHTAVCERVVVGTETVTREEPDPEALKQVPKITVTEEREIVEWKCPESILAGGS